MSLGEELGEFRMPPFRCFFLGDSADCWSSSTATEADRMKGTVGRRKDTAVDSQQGEREAGWRERMKLDEHGYQDTNMQQCHHQPSCRRLHGGRGSLNTPA